jgi:hypothetical protein
VGLRIKPSRALGMSPAALAEQVKAAARIPATLQVTALGQPKPVFDFILGSSSGRKVSQTAKRNS